MFRCHEMKETSYLWISELPPNVTQQSLTDLFSSHGCVLTKIYEAGNLRGALLSFLDEKTAAKACAASHLLNGQSLISEYCDQSGEPGLQRLKDLANCKFPEKAPVAKQEGSKLKVLKVRNFPDRSSDSSVQTGLYHEYKKVGKVTSVQVLGEKDDRHALIVFKRAEDAEAAYELTRSGKSFFGMTLNVERLEEAAGNSEARAVDEFDARASRTLLVDGIESGVTETNLREALAACGTVLDVELKRQADGSAQATVQFADIHGASAAQRRPEGLTVGGRRVRPSFARSQPSNCVWLANLAKTVTEPLLNKTFACHGRVRDVCVNSHRQCALVFFDEVEDARRALDAMKGGSLAGQRLLIDFASQLCQKHFVDELVTSGQCSSNYKLFEQLFASELHRGIIPSRKVAARYREMMLEYVKASSPRPWLKVHDCRSSSTVDASLALESAPSDPAELRTMVGGRRRLASGGGGGCIRRKSGHSSDGDVSTKEGQEREHRLLARLSGFEDARSECSDAETSGSAADLVGAASDGDRPAAATTGWLSGWRQRRKSQSPPLSSPSPASASRPPATAPPQGGTPRPAESSAAGITPVSPQPAGPSASEQDARCLERAVSAYEAALGAHAPLSGLFDCASPPADAEANATACAAGEEEARSSSTMPTPPETSVSPTPPLLAMAKREAPVRSTDAAVELAAAAWNHPYESMYDKIKRRQASRTVSNTSDSAVRVSRPSDSRRPDELTPSRKRPRPRPSAASRQHSAADPSDSDTDGEAVEAAASMALGAAAAAARARQPHPTGHGTRPRGRKSTVASSDAGASSRGGSAAAAAAKAPSAKRQHRASKSGKLNRGKMSVDSVFGSSSDSEEMGAPATPSTVPMTDSSRAESLTDPASPPAANRLTDIFAEAKAQLDPRAVTEKSLFALSDDDDDAFEPEPDLPTIDRFQPDAAAPSPDRSEDAEPPKLAAAHADLETTAAHALAQLSQRSPAITLAQPQFRVPELTLRPLIPAPPPPLPPAPQAQQIIRPAAPESLMLQHPQGPSAQPARPPMQPAAQQDLDQFVQDVIRKVQAAPPTQTAAWDHHAAGDAAVPGSAAPVATDAPAAAAPAAAVEAATSNQQPTISLTGGLAQRPPTAKRSQPAMEALVLQHMDDVIRDVVEGRVDLSPYMDRGRLRCLSGDRFTPTPVAPTVATPARPPSGAPPTVPQSLSMPTPVTTVAPELRLQPVTICPVTTSAAVGIETAAPIQQQQLGQPLAAAPPSSIAMTTLPPATTSTPTESTGAVAGDAAFTQRMQQQQQQQQTQQQVQLQALYMQLFSGRYPQDLLYGSYVPPPPLQLFQRAPAPPQPSTAPPAPQGPQPPPPAPPPPPQVQPPASTQTQQQQQQPPPPQPQSQASGQSSGQLDALLRKYPVKWQGHLALKNDEAGVQMHFVRGSDTLAKAALDLAAPDTNRVLKVAQRMRMEPAQLEGVQRKMVDEAEFCVLLAVACGVNAQDYRRQTHNLREAFIKYLQEKQAAGIVNVNYAEQEVPAYVVHIFPPGQFATAKLQQYAADLYANLFPQPSSETPHLLVVVTTV